MSSRFRTFRVGLMATAAISLMATANVATAQAEPAARTDIQIPAQALDTALRDFGAQSGRTILVDARLTNGKRTRGVSASSDPEVALTSLLAGTGLNYRRDGAVFVVTGGGGGTASANPPAVQVQPGPAPQDQSTRVDDVIVTAQKREERIQDVPIAVSAFTGEQLLAQRIEGGPDLLRAIPNVTFSKSNFSGYNFSIRGVGTKAVSVTTDPAVAVSFNNSPVLRNRFFEQEYFDVERLEVLRGPQGTLYGRNATGGVVNLITAQPSDIVEGQLKAEVGNFDTRRISGFFNLPITDTLAVRVAGASTQRSGYDFNTATDEDVNGRDLWSGRITAAWTPTERFRANLVYERFEEDDDRSRTGKQLCTRDPGPISIAGFGSLDAFGEGPARGIRGQLSQGCLPGSLYDDAAFGTPNGLSLPLYIAGSQLGPVNDFYPDFSPFTLARSFVDPYGGVVQSRDLREISTTYDPVYRADNEIFQLNLEFDLTPELTLSSQTLYSKDNYYASQDYSRFQTLPIFNDSSTLIGFDADFNFGPSPYQNITPGGIYTDPQLGPSNTLLGIDISQAESEQWSQEFRLQSSFDGPFNFSLGANYLRYETTEDYYVLFNLATALADGFFNSSTNLTGAPRSECYLTPGNVVADRCVAIDQNPLNQISGEGHNYFRSSNPYKVESYALFGETYWNVTEEVKITAGLRYTADNKEFTRVPSQLLLAPGLVGGGFVGSGYPIDGVTEQNFQEFTGRLVADWQPELSFTDQTLVYASYAHGYKGGGANPPPIGANPDALFFPVQPQTYRPEFVDAFEIGTKNTLLDGGLILNATAFYYDYKDYQVSQIVDRTALNENFDSTNWGVELETVWFPTEQIRINANLGYLNTELGEGSQSIDVTNRTQGNSDFVLVRPWVQLTSNCIAPTDLVAEILAFGPGAANDILLTVCGGSLLGDLADPTSQVSQITGIVYDRSQTPNGGAGFFDDLSGNELPNSPHWTFNIGAQYDFDLTPGWEAAVRADFYYQGESFARVYNTEYDRLEAWTNTNVSLTIRNPDRGLTFEVYVKNVFDETPITDAFTNSDDTGLTTNVFTLDPRLIGVSLAQSF